MASMSQEAMIRWFADVGDRYVATYLGPRQCDVARLRGDPLYGLQLFFNRFAYERSGAPRGYRIAAVKAITRAWPHLDRVPELYASFYGGKKNEPNNPAFDPALVSINIPNIVALTEQGNLHGAFKALHLRGIAPRFAPCFSAMSSR